MAAGGALDGACALVAGGASGLGRAVVDRFLSGGARVAVLDRDATRMSSLTDAHAGAVLTVVGDVTSLDDQRRCLAEVERSFGRLDALIVTVGIVDYVSSYLSYDLDHFADSFDEVMAVNVRGPIALALTAHPWLARSDNASITFTLSTSAMRVPSSGPVYGLAKAALTHAVHQLAYELAPVVRVNGVVPGAVLDSAIRGPAALGQADQRSARLSAPDAAERAAASNLVGFAPVGNDYASLFVLLASRDGRVATGGVLAWDSGLLVRGHI